MQQEAELQLPGNSSHRSEDTRNWFRRWIDNETHLGSLMVLPIILILLLLVAYPFILSLWLSVTDTVIAREATGNFIGLANFQALLDRSLFVNKVIPNTLIYTFGSVVPKLGLGLVLAIVLNQKWPLRNLLRGVILLPWIVPVSLSIIAWMWFFEPSNSALNYVLVRLNVPGAPFPWLARPNMAMISVMIVNIWRGTPFFAVTLLAAMQSVPKELHEAAQIDGAGQLRRFWSVDIPWIQPVIVVTTLFSLIQTFADLQIVQILTRGGPFNSTHVLATYSYQQAIQSTKIGEGAAISLFLFPALLVVIFFQLRYLQNREV